MIACDGVCELVILQMQKSPGTALRPLPETSCQRKLKANNSTTAKAVQELKILSKATICCEASVWSERIKVNVILNFCFIFSDSRLVSFPSPLTLESSFSRLTFQVRRRTCLGKARWQLYILFYIFRLWLWGGQGRVAINHLTQFPPASSIFSQWDFEEKKVIIKRIFKQLVLIKKFFKQ